MSKIHILDMNPLTSEYNARLHVPVPTGLNNVKPVGISWKDAAIAFGLTGPGTVHLPAGTGPGKISTTEAAAIEAGDVIEIAVTLRVDSAGGTDAQVASRVLAQADSLIAEFQSAMALRLGRYGQELG